MAGRIVETASGVGNTLAIKAQVALDTLFPPEKRSEAWERFRAFASSNPKVTAFLLTNIALSGGPLLLFTIFTVTVFVFSLVAALLIGLVAALLLTVFMALVALFVVLPTLFMTTFTASFLYFWGLGGYYLLKMSNEVLAPDGTSEAMGDKLNNITGGRLSWLMDTARHPPAVDKESTIERERFLSAPGNGLSSSRLSSPAGDAPSPPTKVKEAANKIPAASTPLE